LAWVVVLALLVPATADVAGVETGPDCIAAPATDDPAPPAPVAPGDWAVAVEPAPPDPFDESCGVETDASPLAFALAVPADPLF
jgi:hypothetical protein